MFIKAQGQKGYSFLMTFFPFYFHLKRNSMTSPSKVEVSLYQSYLDLPPSCRKASASLAEGEYDWGEPHLCARSSSSFVFPRLCSGDIECRHDLSLLPNTHLAGWFLSLLPTDWLVYVVCLFPDTFSRILCQYQQPEKLHNFFLLFKPLVTWKLQRTWFSTLSLTHGSVLNFAVS